MAMAGTQVQHLQDNFNIDTHIIIHNLAHLLYFNVNRSCCGHPSCDLSQDRQLSGLRPSDHTWDVHNMIYSPIQLRLHCRGFRPLTICI